MSFDIFERLNSRISKHTRICFIAGLIIGWITHFYMFTHKLPNWDDLNCMGSFGSGDYLGRWFLKYIHPLGSIYSIPAVHGFLFILCLSIAACFVLEIVQIKSTTGAILVPAIMVTFPSVASTMTFMFMAHTSGIAILMVCIAVYLQHKYKYGWIPCIPVLICVLGTYQSYISIAIALMLMGMIIDLLKGADWWKTVKKGILCVIILGVSVVFYMILSHIIYPNIDNETYGGIGNMGKISVLEMPRLIGRCYKRFLEYFIWKPFEFVTHTSQVVNIIVCLLAIVLFVYLIIGKKMYSRKLDLILCCILCGFLPLAMAFVYFMAPEAPYSMLMLYSYSLVYIMVLALLELCMEEWQKKNQISTAKWKINIKWALIAVTCVIIGISCYTDYLVTNRAYFRMDIAFQRVGNYFNRIVASVESQDGFQNGDDVTLIGNFYYKDNPSSVEIDAMDSEDLRTFSGIALENGMITSGARDNFIRYYVGFNVLKLSEDEKKKIAETQEFKEMPDYPSEGSIRKIDNVWVVKLCEY